MSFLPGCFPGAAAAASLFVPASFIFDGTNESLSATQVGTTTDPTRCTISVWMKTNSDPGGSLALANITTSILGTTFAQLAYAGDFELYVRSIFNNGNVGDRITNAGDVDSDNSWDHYVMTWNSNEISADRIMMWKNGVALGGGADLGNPGASASFNYFRNGQTIYLGNHPALFHAKRLAFIDVLDGIAADEDDFGFNDNGTWTRKRYTGSYGTHGFKLDGSTGFTDPINGRVFTGNNMTVGANLDTADLPPYTN